MRSLVRSSRVKSGFTLVELLVVIAIIGILNYESSRKCFPRGRWNLDPNNTGKQTVPDRTLAKSNDACWTVVVLPYAEEQSIASQYDLKKTWFDMANRPAVSSPLTIFICPSV